MREDLSIEKASTVLSDIKLFKGNKGRKDVIFIGTYDEREKLLMHFNLITIKTKEDLFDFYSSNFRYGFFNGVNIDDMGKAFELNLEDLKNTKDLLENRYAKTIKLYLEKLSLLEKVRLLDMKIRENININEAMPFAVFDKKLLEEATAQLIKEDILAKDTEEDYCFFKNKNNSDRFGNSNIYISSKEQSRAVRGVILNISNKIVKNELGFLTWK